MKNAAKQLLVVSLAALSLATAFGDTGIAHDRIPKFKISLTEDGRIWIGSEEITIKQFSAIAAAVAEINRQTRLNLRANEDVDTEHIRKVVTAWGEAGLRDVLFGSLTEDPREKRR